MRVEFRLSLGHPPSVRHPTDRRGKNYTIVRTLRADEAKQVGTHWCYRWPDGWVAYIDAREMKKGERAKKSDGFCGYDWMVRNILRWGTPHCQHEWKPEPDTYPGHDSSERCRWCSTVREAAA